MGNESRTDEMSGDESSTDEMEIRPISQSKLQRAHSFRQRGAGAGPPARVPLEAVGFARHGIEEDDEDEEDDIDDAPSHAQAYRGAQQMTFSSDFSSNPVVRPTDGDEERDRRRRQSLTMMYPLGGSPVSETRPTEPAEQAPLTGAGREAIDTEVPSDLGTALPGEVPSSKDQKVSGPAVRKWQALRGAVRGTGRPTLRIQRGRKEDFQLRSNGSAVERRSVQASKDFHLGKNSGRQVYHDLVGHTGRTKSVRIFDDGKQALTCSDDHTLRVFNLSSGECTSVLGCDRSELLEHRRSIKWFPECLGPFAIQETCLQPKVDFAGLRYSLNFLQVQAFRDRGVQSNELWTALLRYGEAGLSAKISEPMQITLAPDARAPYGIPLRATHFAWGHQVDAAEKLTSNQVLELGRLSSEASFAVNGGFVYINAEGLGEDWTVWNDKFDDNGIMEGGDDRLEVQLNALCVSGLVTLHFGKQTEVDTDHRAGALKQMIARGRFQRITIVPLRMAGARFYCWMFPGEDFGQNGDSWIPADGGGFMYLMSDEDDPAPEDCTRCCYYEHTVAHMNWVRSCCILDGEKQALSCSADHTLRVWNLEKKTNTKIMVGHTNWVWDCCQFRLGGELRALSCSSDLSIRQWDLETGLEFEELRMLGHTDWVLCCRAYDDGGEPKAVSTSRDESVRVWDLAAGTCVKIFTGHRGLVGNCSVYNDAGVWKAVTCSDDMTMKIWDLSESTESTAGCLQTLRGHTDVVVECDVFFNDECCSHMAVSCSWDGTIKVWDLTSGKMEREIADPDSTRLRGIAVQPNGGQILSCSGEIVRVWDLDLLRGADRIVLLDSVEQIAEQLWKWWPHSANHSHQYWAQMLVAAMQQEQTISFTMGILYGRDRDGHTLVHKLAAEPDGGLVLQHLLNYFADGRRKALAGATSGDIEATQAEATIGLLSRAARSQGQSALGMAMEVPNNKLMVRLLLNDYMIAQKALRRDEYSGASVSRYDLFEPLPEADLVRLFQKEKHPLDAAAFLKKLPLRATHGLTQRVYLEQSGHSKTLQSDGMLVKSAMMMHPQAEGQGWWDKQLDMAEETAHSNLLNFANLLREKTTITSTIETALVPIVAATPARAEPDGMLKTCCDRFIFTGCSRAHVQRQGSYLPYSRLLRESYDHAARYQTVELFDAPVLEAIIHQKWHSNGLRFDFYVTVMSSLVFTTLLTVVVLNDTQDYTRARRYCLFNVTLLIKAQVHQLFADGVLKYFSGLINLADTFIHGAAVVVLLESEQRKGRSVASDEMANLSAMLMFTAWLKQTRWLKGFEDLFFIVKVVGANISALTNWIVVLLAMLLAYGLAFFLLMKRQVYDPSNPVECNSWACQSALDVADPGRTDGMIGSMVSTWGMIFGEFSTQAYEKPWRDAITATGGFTLTGSLPFFLLISFMLIVEIVMMNVLIASMQQSYDKVYSQKKSWMMMERASLILTLESLITIGGGLNPPSTTLWSRVQRALQVLCTIKLTGDQQTSGLYLHVLSSSQSNVIAEDLYDGVDATASGEEASLSEVDKLRKQNESLRQQNIDLQAQYMSVVSRQNKPRTKKLRVSSEQGEEEEKEEDHAQTSELPGSIEELLPDVGHGIGTQGSSFKVRTNSNTGKSAADARDYS